MNNIAPIATHDPDPTPTRVWLLRQHVKYEGSFVLGVYATKEKATLAAAERGQDGYLRVFNEEDNFGLDYPFEWLSIREHSID